MKTMKKMILGSGCALGLALSSGAALAGFIDADHRAESVSHTAQPESTRYQGYTTGWTGFIDRDHSAASVAQGPMADASRYAYTSPPSRPFIDWDHSAESVVN